MTDRSTIAQPVYDGRAALLALPMRLIDSLLDTTDGVLDTTEDELSQLKNDVQYEMPRRRSQNGDLAAVGPVDPLFPSDLVEEWARRYSRATFIAWAIEHAQIDTTKFDTTEAQGLPEGGTTLLSPEAKSVTAYLNPRQANTVERRTALSRALLKSTFHLAGCPRRVTKSTSGSEADRSNKTSCERLNIKPAVGLIPLYVVSMTNGRQSRPTQGLSVVESTDPTGCPCLATIHSMLKAKQRHVAGLDTELQLQTGKSSELAAQVHN